MKNIMQKIKNYFNFYSNYDENTAPIKKEIPNFRDIGAYSYPHNAISVLTGIVALFLVYLSLWIG